MKVGILGSGNMGRSLGMVWAELGHDLFFGDIDRQKAQAVAHFVNEKGGPSRVGPPAKDGTVEQAARHGQLLLHSVRDVVLSSMLPSLELVRDKVIVDCNNESSATLLASRRLSHAERLAHDAPEAHVVKAFNTFTQETFEHCPSRSPVLRASCFICGDHPPAVELVTLLAREMGLDAVDCGPLSHAHLLEAMGDFVRIMARRTENGAHIALSLQPVPPPFSVRLGGRHWVPK